MLTRSSLWQPVAPIQFSLRPFQAVPTLLWNHWPRTVWHVLHHDCDYCIVMIISLTIVIFVFTSTKLLLLLLAHKNNITKQNAKRRVSFVFECWNTGKSDKMFYHQAQLTSKNNFIDWNMISKNQAPSKCWTGNEIYARWRLHNVCSCNGYFCCYCEIPVPQLRFLVVPELTTPTTCLTVAIVALKLSGPLKSGCIIVKGGCYHHTIHAQCRVAVCCRAFFAVLATSATR